MFVEDKTLFDDYIYIDLKKDTEARIFLQPLLILKNIYNTSNLKKIYVAPSIKAAENEFEKFKQVWAMYPGAVDVWVRNFEYVAQLFDYGSAIRKIMYTTNAVESIHSSFRKVTKQGAFPNENALLKLLYLRTCELYAKWKGSCVQNWAMVRNQLAVNPKFQTLMQKYENLI